ncbi:MAG: ABC transporter ATP-binding protein/permease [Oscillospiraceae bacterium]|nr:ABC transporter ATP-binding protein/permease [Oscillospiraceae bacterium]
MRGSLYSLKKYLPIAAVSLVALSGEAVCDLLQPSLLARMIDEGILMRAEPVVRALTLRMLLTAFLGMLCAISRAALSSHASQRFGRDLRLRLYTKIQNLPLPEADRFDRASLVTRVTNDAQQVQGFVNGLMRFYMRAPILCVGGIIMAATRSGRMALSLAVVLPIAATVVAISTKIGYPYFYRVQLALDNLNGVMREYLSGVRVVKAFNRFAMEKNRFEESNERLTETSSSAARVLACFGPLVSLVINLGVALVIWLGGRLGEEPGKLVAFINYMNQILFSMSMFANIFNQLVRALVSAKRIDAVLDASDGEASSLAFAAYPRESPTASPRDCEHSLRFEHVTFQYPGASEPQLADISFDAGRGETIGVIGSTGAGKSTLVNLIPRFYEITDGRILLDGRDIRDIDPVELRGRIALVPQTSLLFTGTIAQNVRWGKEDASEDEIWAALAAAQAEKFVRAMPEGLDAMIGRGGVNLSGGQKQRVTIARALVRLDGSIRDKSTALLLDDCASALDANTEAALRTALRAYSPGSIVLMISQRVRSVRQCDRILVLDDGRLAGIGTHDELIRSCDVYKDIYESQYGRAASA